MNDRQIEQELSKMFSSSVDGDEQDFEAMAERVWKRHRRGSAYENFAVFCAALVGCGLSYLVISVSGLPAVIASENLDLLPISTQWIGVIGILITLLSSFRISTFASEQ